MEGTNQDKKIYDLQAKLVDIQCNIAKINAIIFAKKGSLLVNSKASDMASCIKENAKMYGKKIEFVEGTNNIKSAIEANIVRNYILSLENVNKQFDIKYKTILDQKMKLQNKIIETEMIQNYIAGKRDEAKKTPEYAREKELQIQAKFAIDDGDYEKLESINKELKDISKVNNATKLEAESKRLRAEKARIEEAINICEDELNNCFTERKQAIELIAGKKENLLKTADEKYLLVLQDTNWLQRTFGKILNKINGSKRYTEKVINVLSKKVRDISYKAIPALKEKLQEDTNDVTKVINVHITANDVKAIKAIKNEKTTIKGINTATNFRLSRKRNEKKKWKNYASWNQREWGNYPARNQRKRGNYPVGNQQEGKNTSATGSANQTYSGIIERNRSAGMWNINKMKQNQNIHKQNIYDPTITFEER